MLHVKNNGPFSIASFLKVRIFSGNIALLLENWDLLVMLETCDVSN